MPRPAVQPIWVLLAVVPAAFSALMSPKARADRDIGHPIVPAAVAEAAAHGAEPIVLGGAGAAAAGGVAFHARPVEIAFQAPDHFSGLEIITEGEAGEPAFRIRADGGHVPIGTAEAIAGVDTDIEPAPAGGSRCDVAAGRRLIGLRKVRRVRGQRSRQQCGDARKNHSGLHIYRPLDLSWLQTGDHIRSTRFGDATALQERGCADDHPSTGVPLSEPENG